MNKDTNKNLTDIYSPSPLQGEGRGEVNLRTGVKSVSYTKTNKLITALYMVTDMLDNEEPIRNKLRTLGTGIISDTFISPSNSLAKISQIISFLDIASAVNIISEMNCGILRKEFLQLEQSIKESTGKSGILNRPINLSEFFEDSPLDSLSPHPSPLLAKERGNLNSKGHDKSIGHQHSTRIGVQKGSTLLKALSKVEVSDKTHALGITSQAQDFEILKTERRNEINNIIRKTGGSATITDIKNNAQGSLISCSEKTIQRELVSMIKDDVLYKTGEKRWSKYYIK